MPAPASRMGARPQQATTTDSGLAEGRCAGFFRDYMGSAGVLERAPGCRNRVASKGDSPQVHFFSSNLEIMTRPSTKRLLRALAAAATAATLFAATGHAQRQSPFTSMSGSWAGPGTISLSNGTKERIRCRASYRVTDGGADLQLELRCASDSYRFELQSAVSHNAGTISGTWSEATRGAIGTISGTSQGSQINLRASSPVFSAMLAVNTRSNQQSISIQSPGSEISAVSINLSRGSR